MDFAAFVKLWAKEGHQIGFTKEGMQVNPFQSLFVAT
jgi:hypothetical protein